MLIEVLPKREQTAAILIKNVLLFLLNTQTTKKIYMTIFKKNKDQRMVYDTRDYWFLDVVHLPAFHGTLKNTNGYFRPQASDLETPEDAN
jgi:hypothetical protein